MTIESHESRWLLRESEDSQKSRDTVYPKTPAGGLCGDASMQSDSVVAYDRLDRNLEREAGVHLEGFEQS